MEELLINYEQAFILQGGTFQLTFRLADLPRLADVLSRKLEDPQRAPQEAVKVHGSKGNTLIVPAPMPAGCSMRSERRRGKRDTLFQYACKSVA